MEAISLPRIDNDKASLASMPLEIKHLIVRQYVRNVGRIPSPELCEAFIKVHSSKLPYDSTKCPLPQGSYRVTAWQLPPHSLRTDLWKIAEYRTAVITDKLAFVSHEIRQIYIFELKQLVNMLTADETIVDKKVFAAEAAYFEAMGEDSNPRGECCWNIFSRYRWPAYVGSAYLENGSQWAKQLNARL